MSGSKKRVPRPVRSPLVTLAKSTPAGRNEAAEIMMPFDQLARQAPAFMPGQAGVERRTSHCRAAAEHEPHLSVLRPCVERQSTDASQVRVYGMRF